VVKIKRIGKFEEMVFDLNEKEPDKTDIILEKITIFVKNPEDTRLDNHALTGRLEGKFAFSITDDIRIVYELIGKSSVRFLSIGRHKKVYSM